MSARSHAERAGLSPRRPWQGRRVVLGVTGGIAAYKSVQVARDLTRLGAQVDVILTPSAERFVGGLSFEGVTGRPVLTQLFSAEGAALHLKLGAEADAIVVAPATADLLARAAQGRADDLLTTTLLATRAPVVLCPAMNDKMFSHPQVQRNLAHCRDVLGYRIAGPSTGALAVGEADGPGRMIEPDAIVQHVGRALGDASTLRGRRVLITSGPTREAVDPVRFVGNRSSGRMGRALAEAAWRRGAEVTVVSGPVGLEPAVGAETVRVETGIEMRDAVAARIGAADVVLFAAAVADFRPEEPRASKVKRSEGGPSLDVHLVANPDVAAETRAARKKGAVVVGFALETEALVENARKKLDGKGFDLVVANPAGVAGAGFESDTNQVTLVAREAAEELPMMDKDAVADAVLDRVEALLAAR